MVGIRIRERVVKGKGNDKGEVKNKGNYKDKGKDVDNNKIIRMGVRTRTRIRINKSKDTDKDKAKHNDKKKDMDNNKYKAKALTIRTGIRTRKHEIKRVRIGVRMWIVIGIRMKTCIRKLVRIKDNGVVVERMQRKKRGVGGVGVWWCRWLWLWW